MGKCVRRMNELPYWGILNLTRRLQPGERCPTEGSFEFNIILTPILEGRKLRLSRKPSPPSECLGLPLFSND